MSNIPYKDQHTLWIPRYSIIDTLKESIFHPYVKIPPVTLVTSLLSLANKTAIDTTHIIYKLMQESRRIQ